jgi:hypothetical protein
MTTRRLLLLALAGSPRLLDAQGVTTAAIQGSVLTEDGAPIDGATVRVTNTSDGRHWIVVTSASGRYLLEDVAIGGPYRIDVRALGFVDAARAGFTLVLGQRLIMDFTLRNVAVDLSPVTVTATADTLPLSVRFGSEIISAGEIAALPNPSRDFLALTVLSPQVTASPSSRFAPTGGISIGGQNRMFNNFQIDGGVNQDLYTGRLPGREVLSRPISLEAIEQLQVLPLSFDVRHGAAAGGLVNSITKSGTNDVRGTLFATLANAALVGKSAGGEAMDDFTTWEYGGSIGGPIVRDRAHYFLSVDLQNRALPDPGPFIETGAARADTEAVLFHQILENTYGLDAGTLRLDMRVPTQDVFGKITFALGSNSHLEVSHHYVNGDRLGFMDRQTPNVYNLSSAGQNNPTTGNASRLIWASVVGGRWSSEFIGSYLDQRDGCVPNASFPLTVYSRNRGTPSVLAGSPVTCPSTFAQQALEITENLTAGFGAHVLTLGAHGELLHFNDQLLQTSAGLWSFEHLDSLASGQAYHYERSLPGPLRSGGLDFRARQISAYVQDRWAVRPGLTMTLGLRADVPILPDAIPTNQELKTSLGIDTGRLPRSLVMWSPRLGVTYDLGSAGRTVLRGGVGLFSGRVPYTWVGNSYRDDGTKELFLICDNAQVPKYDPINQPAACANGAGPRPRFSFFDQNAQLPQNLKLALGVDHRLPGAIVATLDGLYSQAVHAFYVTDANLRPPSGTATGEGGRPLYGTVRGPTARYDTSFGQVIRVSNRGGDYSASISAELRKQFGDRGAASVLYSYSRAWDRMSLVNYPARANLEQTPLDGTLEDRRVRTSFFERPHRVVASATVRLPQRFMLSLLYAGASGSPFTYVVNGDANADGIGTGPLKNDIVYVPQDGADISLDGNGVTAGLGTQAEQDATYAELDQFIRSEPCLHGERGRIIERNSCRNSWFGTLSARFSKAVPAVRGHSLELMADVYNVLNLVNNQWGQYRATTLDPRIPLLALVGYDAARGRGVYRLALPNRNATQDIESRWQIVLSDRYAF